MYLGIDLGTSSVKAVVVDAAGAVVAQSSRELDVSRPGPRMSEQEPEDWWRATDAAVIALGKALAPVEAVGLSGQMHGAVLLDSDQQPLRPAILWNDGRSQAQCLDLERADCRTLTGNCAMPGFTAPKLLWVREHEPDLFARIDTVLLPKDYLRWRLAGVLATEMSDAAGTLWLDVAGRRWSEPMLAATGLELSHMPALYEGTNITGELDADIARRWGMRSVPVVGGAGDQAAGAVGAGAIHDGQSFISLGTSGVMFVPDSSYRANPEQGVHAFCHALPATWHRMSVVLSAASALTWVSRLVGADSERSLVEEIEAAGVEPGMLFFLPYLSGERTPHNDAHALGAFVGLHHDIGRAELGYAVLEGVAFALADGKRALGAVGGDSVSVIGGGSRSRFWGQLLADALECSLTYRRDAAIGPALGAARLAMLGAAAGTPDEVCRPGEVEVVMEPTAAGVARCRDRHATFRQLYGDLKSRFPDLHAHAEVH